MIRKFNTLSLTKRILIIGIPALYILASIILYFTIGEDLRQIISDKEGFRLWIDSFGNNGEVIFVTIRALQTVVKFVPAEPLEIGAGYIWGTYKGLGLCMLGTEIGSAIILILTSIFGTKIINLLFDLDKINEWSFIQNSKRKYLLLTIIYLIPGTPKDFITYFVGVTKTRILPFLLLTGLARIPSIITSTWCGELLDTKSISSFIIAFLSITAASLLLGYLFNIYRKKQIE